MSPSACCLVSPVTEGISARAPVRGLSSHQDEEGQAEEEAEEEERFPTKSASKERSGKLGR